jgi:hypothetical protein
MISEASLLEQSLDRAAFVCEGKTVRFLGFSKQETATLELVLRSLTLDKRSAKGAYYVAIEPYWGHQSSTSPKGLLNLVNGHQRGSRLAFEGMGPLRFDFVPSMLAEALPNLTLAIKLYKKSMWGGSKVVGSCIIPVVDLVPSPCTTVNAVDRWFSMRFEGCVNADVRFTK